jgi:Tfp pilus assembly protein PilF
MRTLFLYLIAPIGLLLFLYGCGQSATSSNSHNQPELAFANLLGDAEFVGSAACFDCHEGEYLGYQEHGMSNSMYRLTLDNAIEQFGSEVVLDSTSGLHYRTVKADSGFYMEEYLWDSSGRKTHQLFREMQWVVGSGTSARTYLSEQDGWFYELPVTWYTQQKRWDFSPGYRVANKRFERKIVDRCMSCHNSYPDPVLQTNGKYNEMPEGIGCERCHGPGSLHVAARLASASDSLDVDLTIVNPAHLSLDRKLDVCQQCHQNASVSLLRTGRTAYDYRPSEELDDYIALYAAHESNSEGIGVISHAERMKLSACFIETQTLNEPLQCTTCHDPHEGFRTKGPEYFNSTCIDCHAGKPEQLALPSDASHTGAANCIACHMPKTDLIEAPHSAFTDHWIRTVDKTAPKALPTHIDAGLTAVFQRDQEPGSESDVYRGMAEVTEGQRTGDRILIESGVSRLAKSTGSGASSSEALYLHGYGLTLLAKYAEAVAPLEEAVRMDPTQAERLNTLAQTYERLGRAPGPTEKLYREALRIQPALSDVRLNLGRFLESSNRIDEAIVEYKRAIEEEAWNDIAHYNLGTAYLRKGDLNLAEKYLKQAIKLDPFYGGAMSNLGLLYLQQNRLDLAEKTLLVSVDRVPDHVESLDNLGTFYLNKEDNKAAVSMFRRASAAAPTNDALLAKLALALFRNDELAAAKQTAEKALTINRNNELARQIVDALS